ncbi:MAG: thiamine pyrophosphate-requiring protein, partial [Candidatus Dormibacteraeota bacterium]|nr:thiamine pyrophosphate-requiring protein [Candidatus Dormibacteraeota bacterium]
MAMTVGDHLIERLGQWGVKRIYGYPGDGINGLLGAFERHSDEMEFVQVRHEEMAAFMACAHAKFTDEVGVCCATSGPGAIHLLNGLYDAKLDHQPVVAVVGQTYVRAMGGSFQQEVDLLSLYKDVAAEYVQQVDNPAALRHVVDRAMRIAAAERTVTAIIIPGDVQEWDAVPTPPHATHTVHSGVGWNDPIVVPREADLRAAAD